jgi:serine/threonine-protein kinase
MIGKTIQNYRIVAELGSGAMGAVYEAVDTFVERPVAIKVLRAELARQPELIERFRSEAISLARLNHPNIALLYNFFKEGDDYYMAMEFVRGQSLESMIQQSGKLDADMAGRIISQTLEGLAHAHSMGVLHRDIKPANILVTGDGRVKVTDFGIARVLGSSRMTRHGRIIGTLEYIAPERIRGDESDPRSDLYSAGVVLYEMLTGKLPFTGQTDFELIKAHLELEPPSIAALLGAPGLADWDAVVHKAMAKAVEYRFQTAQEFCQSLPGAAFTARTGTGTASVPLTPTPTRFPEAVAPPPPPPGPTPQPTQEALQTASISAAAPKRKPMLMTVLLAATGVMTLLLIFTIILRVRSSSADKKDVTPAQTQTPNTDTTTPSSGGGSSNLPSNVDTNGSSGVVLPSGTLDGKGNTQKPSNSTNTKRQSSAESRREQALRALDGGDSKSKDSKRSKALKALDQ